MTPIHNAYLAHRMYLATRNKEVDPWKDIVQTCNANKDIPYTEEVTTISVSNGSLSTSYDAVLGPDGIIYTPPNSSGRVTEFDTNTDTVIQQYTVSSQFRGGWRANGPYVPSDNAIYLCPYDKRQIGRLDLSAPKGSNISLLPTSFSGISAGQAYCKENNCLYTFLRGGSNIRKTSLDDYSITNIPINSDDNRTGAVTAPNGCIYSIPETTSGAIVKLDPKTDTVTEITLSCTRGSMRDGVLAPNGCIYCIPQGATSGDHWIVKLDTATDEVTSFKTGLGITTSNSTYKACLAPNGCIYIAPHNITRAICVDTWTDTCRWAAGNTISGSNKCTRPCLAPNGCIYSFFYTAGTVLKIRPYATDGSTIRNFKESTLLSPYVS